MSPLIENDLPAIVVNDLGRQVIQALMTALSAVVSDEHTDMRLKLTWQIVVFQQYLIFHRSMPALDFALSHPVIRMAPGVTHFVLVQPVSDSRKLLGLMCTGVQASQFYRQCVIALTSANPMFRSDCCTS